MSRCYLDRPVTGKAVGYILTVPLHQLCQHFVLYAKKGRCLQIPRMIENLRALQASIRLSCPEEYHLDPHPCEVHLSSGLGQGFASSGVSRAGGVFVLSTAVGFPGLVLDLCCSLVLGWALGCLLPPALAHHLGWGPAWAAVSALCYRSPLLCVLCVFPNSILLSNSNGLSTSELHICSGLCWLGE